MAEARVRGAIRSPRQRELAAGGRARAETGVWHRPALLHLVSDLLLLFAAVGLGWALVTWFLSRPLFPLREVVVVTPPVEVTEAQLEYVARTALHGNFFTVDLDAVRAEFEKLPWVRQAEVRRRWPDGIELRFEERRAVARWTAAEAVTGEATAGEGARGELVSSEGEVFPATSDATMPSFSGPQGSAQWLLERHAYFSQVLAPLGVKLEGLSLSARGAWQLKLDNGLVIVLGREQDKAPIEQRLARFVAAWPAVSAGIGIQVAVADLRYPSGFALTPADAPPTDRNPAVKGKQ